MQRLTNNPVRLFVGRAAQTIPTFFSEDKLKRDFSGLKGTGNRIIMMEVCQVESEFQDNQINDEDKQAQMQITRESVNSRKAIDDERTLWKRKDNYDLFDEGVETAAGMFKGVERDDLTVDGMGQIWPTHTLFIGVDTDLGAELMTAIVRGYGFLVSMSVTEAWYWMQRHTS